jgi:raffinose/stachyose/melibiose transport system substrate-binding protein
MKKAFTILILMLVALSFVGAQGKIVLTWWTWSLPTAEDFVVLKKGFEAKYPGIELQSSVNQMDDYKTKLNVEFASSAGPDIMSMQPGPLINTYKPYLLDLSSIAKSTLDKLEPAIVAEAKLRSGGDEIAMAPLGSSSTMFVYYNATYFQKAGINKVPVTLDELLADQATLKKVFPDKVAFTIGLKDGWFNGDVFSLLANMVEKGIVEKADQGKIKWNDPRFVKAMTILQDLVAKGLIDKNSLGVSVYEDSIGMLMDGKAVMHVNGGWNVGNLSDPTKLQPNGKPYADRRGGRATDKDAFGAFVLPNFAGGNPVVIGGIDCAISLNKNLKKNPAKLDAALKLLDYMLVGEGRDWQTGRPGAGLIPSLKGASLNMSIYTDKAAKEGVNAIVYATNHDMAGPRGVSNPAVFNQMGVVVQNVVNGNDVKTELDALQAVADKVQ